MSDSEIVSLQIDDVNNIFYQYVTTAPNRISPPNGTLVPTSGTWTAISVEAKLKFRADINEYQQGQVGSAGAWPKMYNMFVIELPSQGIVKLVKISIDTRFILFEGNNSALTWFVFNYETNEWENFTDQINKSDEYTDTEFTLDLSNTEDISSLFDNNNKLALMVYLNQAGVAETDIVQWKFDYFRADLLYCIPYYTTVEKVRNISNLKTEELSSEFICKFIQKAQDDEIDPVIKGMKTVPFTEGEVPAKIQSVATDIAAGMALRKVYLGTSPNKSAYGDSLLEDARAQLMRLADGTEDLVEDSLGVNVAITTPNSATIFTLGPYPDVSVDSPLDDDDVEGA